MFGEKQRQACNHAHHCGTDGREGGGEFKVAAGGFDQGPTAEDEQKGGQKGEPGGDRRGQCAGHER